MEENIIKRKREELGYSQSQFSEMSGVNFRTLQDYEQGRKPIPSIKGDVLYRISTNLGCSMEELLIESLPGETERTEHLARYREKENQTIMGGQVLEYEEKTIWRRAEASGIAKGISQGISQGISRGIAQTAVASVRNLMSALSVSVEQALDILKISKSDYENYQKLLKKENKK